MAARIQETLVGFGKKKQTDIATPSLAADIWSLLKTNVQPINPNLVTEDDRAEMGKGHEFITRVFKSHWDIAFPWNGYVTAERMAWLGAACAGSSAKTGTVPALTYTSIVADGVNDGLERPYFTFVEQLRTGVPITDSAFVGCACDSFVVRVQSGPGRANSTVEFAVVGSGQIVEPSAIVLPARLAENELPGASLTLTILGKDYVAGGAIISLEWGFANQFNPDAGFFPGSGVQDDAAIRGRIEHGDREATLSFVARKEDATEFEALKNQTVGTAVIKQVLAGAPNPQEYETTFHQVSIAQVEPTEVDGIAAVNVTCAPQFLTGTGLFTMVVKTDADEIGE